MKRKEITKKLKDAGFTDLLKCDANGKSALYDIELALKVAGIE